jgi:energy-coupling factor transport system ATP-binding protein
VLIEHKVDEVVAWVDRVLLMDRGALIIDAPAQQAFANLTTWQDLGVAVPQMVQVARTLPEVFAGETPLSVDATYEALAGTPSALALRYHMIASAAPSLPPSSATPELSWQHVDLVYDRHQVLFDVNFHVSAGDWVALIGANGSGKTSLASLLMGFQSPTRGSISVEGKPVKSGNVSRQARTIAYLFQAADTMLFTATVEQELRFGARHRHAEKGEAPLPVDTVLQITDLADYRATNPFHLSHGQRKRLAIGALLTRRPATLILDEPTTGQDEAHARGFLDFLEELRERQRLTYLMITHDMRAVARYATRLVVLRDGRIALDGAPDAIFARRHELAACGILPPPISQLHARLCGDEAPRVALSVADFLRLLRPAAVTS